MSVLAVLADYREHVNIFLPEAVAHDVPYANIGKGRLGCVRLRNSSSSPLNVPYISTSFTSFLYLASFPISSPKEYTHYFFFFFFSPPQGVSSILCVCVSVGGCTRAGAYDVCTLAEMISEAASSHVN